MTVDIKVQEKETMMRDALAAGLLKQMKANKDVIYFDADLVGAMGTNELFKQFPEQSFDIGIMEANMMGVAAGMSINGKIPFIHSFGVFNTRRIADQVFISGCYNNANVKILGSDPGVTAETNGGTHMPLEDIGVIRSFPGITIVDIADTFLMDKVLDYAANTYGMMYLRFPRKGVVNYYTESNTFEIGKGNVLKDGEDVTLIACGLEVVEALKAADILKGKGVNAAVIDMFTVKPLDADLVEEYAKKTGAIVTAENHNYIGGLGSAVCEAVADRYPVPVKRIGSKDVFGEVGDKNFLMKKFGIVAEDIAAAAQQAIAMKK